MIRLQTAIQLNSLGNMESESDSDNNSLIGNPGTPATSNMNMKFNVILNLL
jgi:hypothetical protein